MNNTQIKCFLAIAEKKSFTKAVDEVYISQPNISRSIAAFEEELGVTLFDRTNKNVELTEAGELYFDFFKRFQLEFQKTKKKVEVQKKNRQGNIRLGYIEGWTISSFLPQILKKFSDEYMGIDITIECDSYKNLINSLKTNKLDVIICLDKSLEGEIGIRKRTITEIQKIILYSEFHHLAKETNITPYDFKNEVFYVMNNEEKLNIDMEIRKYCETYGFIPKIKSVNNIETVLASVQNGMGVTIYDVWGRNINTEGFKHVMMDSFHKVSMVWCENTTNVAISVLINEIYFFMKQIKTTE